MIKKDIEPSLQSEPLSDVVTIRNLLHTVSRFKSGQNLNSGFIAWSCEAVKNTVITTKVNNCSSDLPYFTNKILEGFDKRILTGMVLTNPQTMFLTTNREIHLDNFNAISFSEETHLVHILYVKLNISIWN